MKVLVTGGTGFIASHLVRRLLQSGWEVSALARPSGALDPLKGSGVRVAFADLAEPESLERIDGDWDAVVNAAGLLGKFGTGRDSLRAVNTDGAERLFEFAQRRNVKRFVHLGTVGVTGPAEIDNSSPQAPPPLRDEETPCRPASDYQRSKLDGEKALIWAQASGSCSLTILRAGFTYGPGDLHKLPLFQTIHKGRFFFIGPGNGFLQPIFVEDLARGIEQALQGAGDGTRVFNMCGDSPVTWKDFAGTIAKALGRPLPRLSVPEALCRPAATVLEALGAALSFAPPLTHSRIDLMTRSYTYSVERARNAIGFRPEVGLEEGITRTVNWYRANGAL
ncbi:MAG: NAD(P)-dependent oxidoreductase [Nitrospinae bacterium]|nr:NAD(P)-dependent oxidoreductase [Nitrospinota bacterium]